MFKQLGKLEQIDLSGYRSIRRMSLRLTNINVLVGANGAGKSNFIGFFRFMHRLATRELRLWIEQQGGADRVLHFGRKSTAKLFVSLRFAPNRYHCRLVATDDDRLVFEDEWWEFHAKEIDYKGGHKSGKLAKAGDRESGLPIQPNSKSPPGHIAGYIRDWRVYHFHDTSSAAKVKGASRLHDKLSLQPDAGNLAAFLKSLTGSPAYDHIVTAIRRIAPFFQDFVLEPEPNEPNSIRLRWRHAGNDADFDVNDLSDGTLRFICLATLLLQPRPPGTIILDEPELGLHPHALALLAGLMKSVSTRTQIIVATQSVTFANQFSWEDLVVVDRDEHASTFRRLREKEVATWLDEFAVGELWEKNLIGGTA